jgi:hypothetical protein
MLILDLFKIFLNFPLMKEFHVRLNAEEEGVKSAAPGGEAVDMLQVLLNTDRR